MTTGLVEHVNAVTPTVTTRNTRWLAVESKPKVSELTELTHRVLWTSKSSTETHAHWEGTLHTTVNASARRRKARRLERKNLVRSQLLLIKSLLLLLQSLDLILEGDLRL